MLFLTSSQKLAVHVVCIRMWHTLHMHVIITVHALVAEKIAYFQSTYSLIISIYF